MIEQSRFPHGAPRAEQKIAIDWLNESDKKYLILELPTGVGKSALGFAACESAEDGGYYLTATKQLQEQIVEQYGCKTIKGRANYQCNKNMRATSCETGPCLADKRLIGQCIDDGMCDYYCLREKIKKEKTFLTSYAYLFRCAQCADWLTQRDVIVFDEAHDLEKQLVGFAQIDFDPEGFMDDFYTSTEVTDEMRALLKSIPNEKTSPAAFFSWLKDAYYCIIEPKYAEIKSQMEEMSACFSDKLMLKKLIDLHQRQYLKVDKLREKMVAFVETTEKDWLFDEKDGVVKAVPLDVSWIFGKYVEPLGKKFVFMSATIVNHVDFARSIGLDIGEVDYLSLDSPFPSEKSPIYILPCEVSMNYASLQKEETMVEIMKAVKFFLNRHKDDKGIVHCGNMTIAKYIKDHAGEHAGRLLIRHGNDVNATILEKHVRSKAPTVLVSSSMLEGVDLYDDLSRWQLFIKLPWLSLGDKRIKRLSETRGDWYEIQMWRAFVQGCGRSTRSESDSSTTYVIDPGFSYRYGQAKAKKWFSPKFQARIVTKK